MTVPITGRGTSTKKPLASASDVASQIIASADRDLTFVVHIVGESQYLLVRNFETFIEEELARHGIFYGEHVLLRPLVEHHARELTEFVLSGVAIHHRISLHELENPVGDPLKLLRSDLWDSIRSHIEDVQQHFITDVGGLQKILTQLEENKPKAVNRPTN